MNLRPDKYEMNCPYTFDHFSPTCCIHTKASKIHIERCCHLLRLSRLSTIHSIQVHVTVIYALLGGIITLPTYRNFYAV